MRLVCLSIVFVIGILVSDLVMGQGLASADPDEATFQVSPGMVTPTPEMWFYQQELKRLDDPKLIMQRKAQAKSEARRARLESLRWYGMSNSRPYANPYPVSGYSPRWVPNPIFQNSWSSGKAGLYYRSSGAHSPMIMVR